MPFNAQVYNVLIGSPGDLQGEREMIPDALSYWNQVHSQEYGIVLVPVMWERNSYPQLGERPQALINKQMIKNCDIMIAAFWTRVGTPTGKAESGTLEEIQELRDAGKPVLLYFSARPVDPTSIDPDQYGKLLELKSTAKDWGLYDSYNDLIEFREKILRHITQCIRDLLELPNPAKNEKPKSDSLKHLFSELKSNSLRLQSEWVELSENSSNETDAARKRLLVARNILERLLEQGRGRISRSTIRQINQVIHSLEELVEMRIFMDGGESLRRFWSQGESSFEQLINIANEIIGKAN